MWETIATHFVVWWWALGDQSAANWCSHKRCREQCISMRRLRRLYLKATGFVFTTGPGSASENSQQTSVHLQQDYDQWSLRGSTTRATVYVLVQSYQIISSNNHLIQCGHVHFLKLAEYSEWYLNESEIAQTTQISTPQFYSQSSSNRFEVMNECMNGVNEC